MMAMTRSSSQSICLTHTDRPFHYKAFMLKRDTSISHQHVMYNRRPQQSIPFTLRFSLICLFCDCSAETLRSLLRLSLPSLLYFFETLTFRSLLFSHHVCVVSYAMASLLTPVAVPGGPSFFQSWALRLPEGVDTGVSSPSVSPSCVHQIARSPVLERSELKKTYLPSPPDSSKHEVISSHRELNTSCDESSEDAGQSKTSRNAAAALYQQRTRSRTSSNGSKILKFLRRSVRSKEAKADQSPPAKPSVAEVGQTGKKKHLTRRASFFTSLQSASVDNSVSNPTCEPSQPPSTRTPKAEVERTAAKKKDRRRRSVFSSFQGATIDKPDPIIQVEDSQPPRVTIIKVSPPAETQALEPVASSINEPGDSRRSSGIEVLYDRSKRFLKGIGRQTSLEPALNHIDPRPTTKVSELLDRVNSILVHQTHNNTLRSPTPGSLTSPHLANARFTPLSHKPVLSSSSSIRNLKMGKPPVNTPDSAALYGGPDDREFFKVEISNPDGPTFLPSEARRIGTPPLPSEGPHSRRRGFFFDLNAPNANAIAIADFSPSDGDGDEPDTPRNSAELLTPHARLVAAARRRSAGHNDWFSLQLMVEDAGEAEEHFELNVPEHLIGSPLCPRSPMHKSGGKGVCVYHGRNKSFSLE